MKVINFREQKNRDTVTFLADWILPRPTGTRSQRYRHYLQRLLGSWRNFPEYLRSPLSARQTIFFTVPRKYAASAQPADAFFLVSVGVALYLQEDLFFDAVVSQEFIDKVPELEKYFDYGRTRAEITITCQIGKTQPHTTRGEAQFFTLGVDSFYTLLCHRPKKTRALIFVDGFDVPLPKTEFLHSLHTRIQRVAKKTNTTTVFVQSNLRESTDGMIGWGQFHVAALAAVSQLLNVKTIFLSGETFDWPDWGLRTGVDTLLSTPQRKISLVGHDIPREKKIPFLQRSRLFPLFLEQVRVCWLNVEMQDTPYNCSVCQKCLRTKLTLLACGVEHTPTFSPLQLEAVQNVQLNAHVFQEWQALPELLRKRKTVDEALIRAVQAATQKPLPALRHSYRTYRV